MCVCVSDGNGGLGGGNNVANPSPTYVVLFFNFYSSLPPQGLQVGNEVPQD